MYFLYLFIAKLAIFMVKGSMESEFCDKRMRS